jgi:hypothetical protein
MATSAPFAAVVAAVALVVAPPAAADGPPAQAPSPVFERLKSLAGEWAGTAAIGGKDVPTRAAIRVVSAGSAVMITTDPGGAHEMVTLIHRDGDALVATHYCAAQNQPRMRAIPGADPSRIVFEFVDGTNLAAFPARMQRLSIAMPSPDRHLQEWTFRDGAKDATDVFEMKRVR